MSSELKGTTGLTLVFDGRRNGAIIAILNGVEYSQTFERCGSCDKLAMVLTPLEGGEGLRSCRCLEQPATACAA